MVDALAAGGGVIVWAGALFISIDVLGVDGDNENGAALVMAGLLALSFVALALLPPATHPAWIATTALSIPMIFGYLFFPDVQDFADVRPFFLLTIGAWVLAFFLPRSRGRGIFAALAMILLWVWVMGEVAFPDSYSASRLVPPYVNPIDQIDAVRGADDTQVVTAALPAQTTTLDDLDPSDPLYPLAEDCANGDDAACDDLWNQSDPGSDFEDFANICGGRYSDGDAESGCEFLLAPNDTSSDDDVSLEDLDSSDPLFPLAEDCANGDDAACDDLYGQSDFGSDFESFADTCGGREGSGSGGSCDISSDFDGDSNDEFDFDEDGFDDDFDDDLSDELFAPSPVGPEDDTARDIAIVSAIFALLYLGALRLFDSRGLRGVGTAFVIPGVLTLQTAVYAFGVDSESVIVASLLALGAGMLLALIGHWSGGRRFTTWFGGSFASVGAFGLALDLSEIEDSFVNDSGDADFDLVGPALITIAFGLALVAVAFLLARTILGWSRGRGETSGPPSPPSPPPDSSSTTTWAPPTAPTPPPAPAPSPPDPGSTWGPPKEPDPPPGGWGALPPPAPPPPTPPFES